jgi:hypothetical protein
MDVNGMEGGNPAESSLSNDLGMDLSDPGASGTSPEVSNPLLGESGTGSAAQPQYKFAGKEYPNQQAAEAAYKKLYGSYSETKGIVNTVKEALNNPELLEALSEDPKWASIFAKLGIDTAIDQAERSDPSERAQEGSQQYQEQMRQWQIERDVDRIEREEYRFERELGRPLNPQERRATLDIIRRAESLTFKEAYQLANHERLVAESRKAAITPRQVSNRPAPPPSRLPGQKVSTQKPVNKMTESEWKANLASDPDIRELLSRQG